MTPQRDAHGHFVRSSPAPAAAPALPPSEFLQLAAQLEALPDPAHTTALNALRALVAAATRERKTTPRKRTPAPPRPAWLSARDAKF